jgi:hypothetical protein
MSKVENTEKSSATELNWALIKRMLIPALIAVYLILGLLAAGWLLLDISTGQFRFFGWIGITLPENDDYLNILKLVCYAGIGGAIGGITYGMLNLQQHTAARYDFNPVYVGDYVFRPFGSAALAVVIFALLRGGVLTILGGDPSSASTSIVASFSAFGIGFLAGFGSKQVIDRLNELIKETFSASEDKEGEEGDGEEDEEKDV